MSTSESGGGDTADVPKKEITAGSSPANDTNKSDADQTPGASKNNRQRRRSNTKGDGKGDGSNSRNGSRHNSVSNAQNQNQNGQKSHSNRKDWSERKSISQGGSSSAPKANNHKSPASGGNQRTRSSNSQSASRNQRDSARTMSQASNGEGLDYSDELIADELEEPFSDSEDEDTRPKKPEKMNLTIARGRIRTLSGTVPPLGHSPHWGGPTMCVSCLQFFNLPDKIPQFADHMLKEHKIVVSEMNLIVDPKRYIEHWRQRFVKESIDTIFPKIEPLEGDVLYGETDYYYLMSENVAEDRSLRQRLAMRRLEEALSCQQREREDTSFQLQCIFCRYNARGNRSKIIHHLYMIHHLNLGSPDNLVFVKEYIEHLKEKLHRNECIYCEKIFPDRNTLMDHMRKRNHREVNPKNHYYDKFYIINYLELGKRWLDVLAEDFEDTMPTFQDSDEEEEDNEWCEWQEDNLDDDETRVVCLVCDSTEDNAQSLLEHMKTAHEFDLLKQIEENKLNNYQRVRLINYIRKQTYHAECWVCQKTELENPLACQKHIIAEHKPLTTLPDPSVWDVEENLVPLFGNDHFLWMLESILEENEITCDSEEDVDGEERLAKLVLESKTNTVEGVIAEDLPELTELTEDDLNALM